MRLLALAVLALPLAGCADSTPLEVTASSYPVAFLAEWIGGAEADVHGLLPPGVLSEDWTPPTGLRLRGDLFLFNGAGAEPWAAKLAAASGVPVLDVADGLVLLEASHDDEEEESHHHHAEGHLHAGDTDGHTWMDAGRMAQMAANVERALSERDPSHAGRFAARSAQLQQALQALDARYAVGLRQCESRHILTDHDAYGYYQDAYDVVQHVVALDAAEELAQLRLAYNATHVVLAGSPSSETVLHLDELGMRVAPLHGIGALNKEDSEAGATYFTLMNANLATLREILRCA